LRDTLGSLVKGALEQVGVVREVVERGAKAQRSRYDAVRMERQRRDALAALGEVVYRRAVSGRLGALADDAEVAAQIEEIDALDQRIEAADQPRAEGFRGRAGWPRRGGEAKPGRGEAARVWRPVPASVAPAAADGAAPAGDARTARDDERDQPPAAEIGPAAGSGGVARTGAGIRFGGDWDDDDDLEEYMHADDVPHAPTPPGPARDDEPAPEPPRRRSRRRAKSQPK
jgi:hypothetical protein